MGRPVREDRPPRTAGGFERTKPICPEAVAGKRFAHRSAVGNAGSPAGLQNEPGMLPARCVPGCETFDKTKPIWFGRLVSEPGTGVARSFDGNFADFSVFNFSSG
jgi:hypothetical protein